MELVNCYGEIIEKSEAMRRVQLWKQRERSATLASQLCLERGADKNMNMWGNTRIYSKKKTGKEWHDIWHKVAILCSRMQGRFCYNFGTITIK